jgi:nucleoid-associated protein YgaU
MKKYAVFVLIFVSFGIAGVRAQSLEKNEYYRLSVDYANRSQQSLEDGDYARSAEYAVESQRYAELSRQYIARMLLAYQARSAYVAAKARLDKAVQWGLASWEADLYADASGAFDSGSAAYDGEDYEACIPDFRKVVELLRDFESRRPPAPAPAPAPAAEPEEAAPAEETGLAAFYEVKLNLLRRDCLWRIAEFDFIYGDPHQWPRLYEANKDTFPDPDNPNLIVPGQVLKIPPIRGEQRSGTR